MTKRILGLVLALCMIAVLLPVTAQAAGTLKYFRIIVDDGAQNGEGITWTSNLTKAYYGKTTENGLFIEWSQNGYEVDETNYNIKAEQTDNGLEVTLRNANLIRTKSLLIGMNINFDGAVTINLIGENVIDYDIDVPAGSTDENNQVNALAAIYVKATKCTITGTGSLTAKADGMAGKGAGGLIDLDGDTGTESKSAEVLGSVIEADCDLTIKETTLDLDQVYSGGRSPYGNHGIRCSGNLTIDNANVNIYAQYGAAIKLATSRKDTTLVANKDLTITNGSKVTVEANEPALKVGTGGSIIFDGTNGTEITIKDTYRPFNKTPVLKGEYDEVCYANNKNGTSTQPYVGDPAGGAATSSSTHPNWLYFHFVGTELPELLIAPELNNTLDMAIAIEKEYVTGEGYYAEFVGSGGSKKFDLVAGTGDDVGYYIATLTGLTAKQMTDEYTVTVYNGNNKAVSKSKTFSIASYAETVLSTTTDETLKTLLVDMLNYGAEAQKKFTGATTGLANDCLEETQKTIRTVNCTGSKPTGEGYMGTNFLLESTIAMAMAFDKNTVGEGAYAIVTFNNHKGTPVESVEIYASDDSTNNITVFISRDLVAADGHCEVTWTIYKADGSVVETVVDSLASYTARALAANENDLLVKSAMAYSDSAKAYFNSL